MGVVRQACARRGEIWLTRLDPTEGHQIQKTRPCLVVSPDAMNRFLGTITVMPMTSVSRPTRFRVKTQLQGKAGLLLGDQIRSVAKARLLKPLGHADADTLSEALAVLREMFEEE